MLRMGGKFKEVSLPFEWVVGSMVFGRSMGVFCCERKVSEFRLVGAWFVW